MGLHKICKHKGRARDAPQACVVGQLSRQTGEPGEMDEPRIEVQGLGRQALDELTAAIRDVTSTSEVSIHRPTTRR